MPRTKKPWYEIMLDRIDQKGRNACSTQTFIEQCDDLLSSQMEESEQLAIIARLGLMIDELKHPSEEISRRHLEKIRQELVDKY